MKTGTSLRLFLVATALTVIALESTPTAKAEPRPPWLKDCQYDAQGHVITFTCDYVTMIDKCSADNC
jgi:hypothetical protein